VNLVRITTTIFQCVPDRTGRYVEQVNLYSYAGYRQEALLRSLTARIFLVLPVAMFP